MKELKVIKACRDCGNRTNFGIEIWPLGGRMGMSLSPIVNIFVMAIPKTAYRYLMTTHTNNG